MFNKEAMARNLRGERVRAGLTQAQLGEAVGLSTTQIVNLEKGKSDTLLSNAWKISEVLNVSLDYLCGRE